MEFLYKQKDAPTHLHNLSVTHDLTKNETEEIKTKVQEAIAKEQEGQHPLTGQRAANFRLLANQ